MSTRDSLILIKGAGEMASASAHRLFRSGFTRICLTEIEEPLSVRRAVSFCETVYAGSATVEGVTASLVREAGELESVWARGRIGVIVDPEWRIIGQLQPYVVIDAIMAKRNTGTTKTEAPVVIGIGPGFSAPQDVHLVVESNRGHNLGRVISSGAAEPHTGIPGSIGGHSTTRVLRSPHDGGVRHLKTIGDLVAEGDGVLLVDETPVFASIDGVVRGLIREIRVSRGAKLGDIDPRGDISYCFTISEKARAIAGGVLEAVLSRLHLSLVREPY